MSDIKASEARISNAIERLSALLEGAPSRAAGTAGTADDIAELRAQIASLEERLHTERTAHEALKVARQGELDELDKIIARFEGEQAELGARERAELDGQEQAELDAQEQEGE